MSNNRFIKHDPLTVAPDTLLSEAIALMNQQQADTLNCVLVVAAGKLTGILTSQDVVRAIAKGYDLTATVDVAMSRSVITIAKSQIDNVDLLWALMQKHSINYLPILGDEGEVLGVIDTRSLLSYLQSISSNLGSKERTHGDNNHGTPKIKNYEPLNTNLERFFGFIPSMLCIVGFDGYFKLINPTFIDILGFTEEELLSEHLINFVHPEDRAATEAELQNLIAGNTTVSFENRYRTKDGDDRWLLWTAKPYVAEAIIYAAARDITERKQTELALKENEERWQLALRGSNDGLWDWNVKTNEVFFSRRWKEMLGFGEAEISNTLEEWSKRVHPDDLGWVTKVIQNHFAQKTPFYTSEHRVLCKDGSYKWILDRGQALWDEAGNVIRMIGSHTDISDRKKAELQLQRERDFSHAVIDTVGALIAVLDRQGRIVNFNHTCEQITGYSYREIKGRQVWDVLIAPEEISTLKAVYERLLTGQVPNQYTNYWLGKDGSHHLISWSNTALFDEQGKVEFIIATGIDISEQRRVWNKLEHQYRQTKLLAEITRKIRMSIDLEEILQTTVTEVQHLLNCDRVLIVQIKSHNSVLPISESVIGDLPSMLGYEISDPLLLGERDFFPTEFGDRPIVKRDSLEGSLGKYLPRYSQGEILAIENLATAPVATEIKQLLNQFQIQAKLVVPILSQSQVKGLLVAHQCYNPREWQDNEIELLTQLADQIGVALSQAQLLDNLEEMVALRTVELTTTNQLLQQEIVEHKQTEAVLRENQQKLAGILDNANEAIISVDEQQYIQLFNRGAEQIFGYKARDIIGQPLEILLPHSTHQIHRQHIAQFSQSPQPYRMMEQRNDSIYGRRKNGEEFPAEASIAKLRTKKGLLFTVILNDITERQQARETLQASQALLAKAEKIAKIGSWEDNLVTQQLSWSEELFEMLGFDKERGIPSCEEIIERIHPEDLLLVKNTLRLGHDYGKPWQFNYRFILPNGELKYLESRGEPTVNSEGKVLKVWGTMMDITGRVQAEKSLQRSEEQLRLITDGLPVLIAYVDKQQRYLYNNRTYETWFGKPRSALLGLHLKELLGKDDYQQVLPYIKTVLAGEPVTFEMESLKTSNNCRWISATYIPDFDTDNEVRGFFAMIEDITNRKEIERMKSEFVSIASHEMRTPLTSIHGTLELLNIGRLGELAPEGQAIAKMALRNSDRLIHLINDILDLERMESSQENIERKLCDSAELVRQAIDTVNSMAQEQQIVLQNDAKSLELWGDSDRLLQTLINLLGNAIKFSRPGGTVWITCDREAENILFAIKDRGRGIPQDKLETIFERFQQVDASDSRQKGGTGLGLAICRHIVQQHGGKIWAESVYGEGSTFFFTIPQQHIAV